MHRHVYYFQITWLPLSCTVKSFHELHSHTMSVSAVSFWEYNHLTFSLSWNHMQILSGVKAI